MDIERNDEGELERYIIEEKILPERGKKHRKVGGEKISRYYIISHLYESAVEYETKKEIMMKFWTESLINNEKWREYLSDTHFNLSKNEDIREEYCRLVKDFDHSCLEMKLKRIIASLDEETSYKTEKLDFSLEFLSNSSSLDILKARENFEKAPNPTTKKTLQTIKEMEKVVRNPKFSINKRLISKALKVPYEHIKHFFRSGILRKPNIFFRQNKISKKRRI